MGQTYDHLSLRERVEIELWRKAGHSLRRIGQHLGRSPATISRELRRNARPTRQWRGLYDGERAHALAQRRRRWQARFKLARQPDLRARVRQSLAMGHSPEQIAGRLARRGSSPASFIRHRLGLADRPPEAGSRQQEGHWEADLMGFSRYGQYVLVLHERCSRLLLVDRLPNKSAAAVLEQMHRRLRSLPEALRRTLTFDNGTAFALHYRLRQTLGLGTFFCDPHAPWQKGGIENAIGRLRRSSPRKADLAGLVEAYNATPRKCLAFLTPAEVF